MPTKAPLVLASLSGCRSLPACLPPAAAAAPLPAVSPEQLRAAEAHVMRLETELGTSHPEVRRQGSVPKKNFLVGA